MVAYFVEGYNIHIGGFVCKNSVRKQQMSHQINGLGFFFFFLFFFNWCLLLSKQKKMLNGNMPDN